MPTNTASYIRPLPRPGEPQPLSLPPPPPGIGQLGGGGLPPPGPPPPPWQTMPAFQGFPAPFPSQSPPNVSGTPEERTMQRLQAMGLPQPVMDRLMLTLTGKPQVPPPALPKSAKDSTPKEPSRGGGRADELARHAARDVSGH